MITIDEYFTDYVSKQDRRKVYSSQFNPQIQINAEALLIKINALLNDLGMNSSVVTSGWRPPVVNSATPNAATHSGHLNGMACDILDDNKQTLAKLVSSRPDLLKKYELFVEDLNYTRGKFQNWCHIDCLTRNDRPSRSFIP